MMRKPAIAALATSLLLVSTAPAQPPVALTVTQLGSVRTGVLRSEDPRISEINAYDSAGRRIYLVNPKAGLLDVIDANNPAAPVQGTATSRQCVSTTRPTHSTRPCSRMPRPSRPTPRSAG